MCVHTRETSKRASSTPADGTDENTRAGVDDRAAAVTLARVLATGRNTGADHRVVDLLGGCVLEVVGLACSTADDRDIDLAEGDARRAAARSCAPWRG